MAKKKTTRQIKGANSSTQPLTDELYDELSAGQQFIAVVAESAGVPVQVAEYEERFFIHRETIEAAYDALFELQPAAAPAQ